MEISVAHDHFLTGAAPLASRSRLLPPPVSANGSEGVSSSEAADWQKALDLHTWTNRVSALQKSWIEMLSRYQWDWFVTLTFKDSVHPEAADKRFRVWLNELNTALYGRRWRQRGQGVYWAKALEYQKRGVIHFHVLMSDTQNLNETLRRLTFMDKWKKIAGFSKIEVPNQQQCVARYCAKYIVKGGEIDLSPTLSSYARQA